MAGRRFISHREELRRSVESWVWSRIHIFAMHLFSRDAYRDDDGVKTAYLRMILLSLSAVFPMIDLRTLVYCVLLQSTKSSFASLVSMCFVIAEMLIVTVVPLRPCRPLQLLGQPLGVGSFPAVPLCFPGRGP